VPEDYGNCYFKRMVTLYLTTRRHVLEDILVNGKRNFGQELRRKKKWMNEKWRIEDDLEGSRSGLKEALFRNFLLYEENQDASVKIAGVLIEILTY
jgi:hypothetical protein